MKLARSVAHKLGITNASRFEREAQRTMSKGGERADLARAISAAFQSSGGLQPPLQVYKLFSLMQLLDQHGPSGILELGSGSSTVVFAASGIPVVSVDESEEWLENTRSMVAKFAPSASVEFLHRPVQRRLDEAPPRFSYENLPENADMLFVDGPALQVNGTKYPHAVCEDAFHLEWRQCVVDMRQPTALALAAVFEGRVSDILTKTPKRDFSYFSVFTRP